MNIDVSIITPNFNSGKFIISTYESLSKQSYSNWEWIVVDDGSLDTSPTIIKDISKKDTRVKFYERENDKKGASVCRNIGIQKCHGEYVIFLDADDLLTSFCIEKRVNLMRKYPLLDFGVFKMGYFLNKLGDKDGFVNLFFNENEEYLRSFISYKIPWAITCPIWKSLFLKSNMIRFSEGYQRLQDPEFHTKILISYNANFKVFKDSVVDCYYRQGINSKKTIKSRSFQNITNGFIQYICDTNSALEAKNYSGMYTAEVNDFVSSSLHSLLFMHRLSSKTNPHKYYNQLKKEGISIPVSKVTITLFYFFNLTRLSFIKGIGITRLWKILTK